MDQRASPPHYRGVREIGRGGMGIVYCAEQRSLNREVALKMVSPDLKDASARNPKARPSSRGASITPTSSRGDELIEDASGDSAFVMKLIKGQSWSEHFKAKAGFEEHMSIFLSVCNAIEYAHDKGLAHLDLKPDNVAVGALGEVLVMDWGLAVDIRETQASWRRDAQKPSPRSMWPPATSPPSWRSAGATKWPLDRRIPPSGRSSMRS